MLRSVLSSNTTFLIGRKGTGKSTVFAKAQSELRDKKDVISIYIDVKSLSDVIDTNSMGDDSLSDFSISALAYRAHVLRKAMLGKVISELLSEIRNSCDRLTLFERWKGISKQYKDLIKSLEEIGEKVKRSDLEKHEIPILQKISTQINEKTQTEKAKTKAFSASAGGKADPVSPNLSGGASGSFADFDRALDDSDVYNEYSDVVLKSFPFNEIIEEVQTLVNESGLTRLVVFFDDFSELGLVDQRLFVDVVLSPLNNASNESIKLKVAGYPGRIYYGKIDPSKVDTLSLDFSSLYEANEVQEMEKAASDYAYRLLVTRFEAFGVKLEDFFDVNVYSPIEKMVTTMFRASFNVPRIMGHILQICYLDKVSKGEKISQASIRLAARKHYEHTIYKYFDRMNRYALEPFQNKLDRHNQNQLLECIISEARSVRKKIIEGEVGGKYFDNLGGNPPTSHFIVSPELEDVLLPLESNFFLSKYKHTRDKEGRPVIVYALLMGLCESERMSWGFPEGREYRNYFVQRCFEYTRAIHQYLSNNQTIKCGKCGFCHPMEQKQSIELFKWTCPECLEGTCKITNLSDDFKEEVKKLDKDIMLDPIELSIVTTLNDENRKMRAGEISGLIDTTHQMVGKRTSKLQEMGLVEKCRDTADGKMKSCLTARCKELYFT